MLVLADFQATGESLVQVGTRFDVLKLPAALGTRTLRRLREAGCRQGPVLQGTDTGCLYILLAPGAAADWTGAGTAVGREDLVTLRVPIPGAVRGGRCWLTPPGPDTPLTDPAELATALATAQAESHRAPPR
ncbi:hypothetical protein BIV57_03925 [Mangrovactinospora gilvigrisea]|uniref:DNA primase/polymerase bifunctional N-terminal domain-containing protein n=2 Tax=Mangrovactinospora gilvigrisea TaxID=1428644 RepID=A0A1J7BJK3_9ACTN|nr:hypothetical protein BIV57_03925 [Mangrovactinospora gilvigrisea]